MAMYRVDPIKLPKAMYNLVGDQVIKLSKTMYRVDNVDPIKLTHVFYGCILSSIQS